MTLKEERANYIKERLDSVTNKGTEVNRLSTELFISKRSVYLDYQKAKNSY